MGIVIKNLVDYIWEIRFIHNNTHNNTYAKFNKQGLTGSGFMIGYLVPKMQSLVWVKNKFNSLATTYFKSPRNHLCYGYLFCDFEYKFWQVFQNHFK